jgi:O-antigen/teichoic acid export membrane protein
MANVTIKLLITGRLKVSYLAQLIKKSVFIHNVLETFATKITIVAIGFASSVVTARYLGPEGRGILVVLITITGMAMQFANFGLHASNTYFIAKDRDKLPQIIGNTLWLSLVGGSVILIIVLSILYYNQNLIIGIPISYLLITLISIPFSLFFMLGQNILLGLQEVRTYNMSELFLRLASFIVIALLLIVLEQDVAAVVTVNTFFAIVFSLGIMKILLPNESKLFSFDTSLFKQMIRYGFKAYLAAIFSFLVIRFDILMVNYFLGPNNAGVYSIAVQIADLLYILPVTIGMILFPKISRMKEGSWEFTKKTVWVTAGIMFVVCFLTAFFARPFITLFYGNAFSGATEPLLWLLPGIYALSLQTIFMNYFVGIGFPTYAVYYHFIGFGSNVFLNYILIPKFSLNGAAIASTLSYSIIFFAALYFFKKEK